MLVQKHQSVQRFWKRYGHFPGFPIGGANVRRWVLFGENVCENERILGPVEGASPLDPRMLSINKPSRLNCVHFCVDKITIVLSTVVYNTIHKLSMSYVELFQKLLLHFITGFLHAFNIIFLAGSFYQRQMQPSVFCLHTFQKGKVTNRTK